MDTASQVLQQYFGYSSFRPLQKEIISDVLNKRDVLAIMPTGSGKSLCYQVPALVNNDKLTIVVSPLIALMKDQVDGLRENGVKAAYLNSSLTNSEQQKIKQQLSQNQLSLLYVAPERLAQTEFLEFIGKLPVQMFAIDEAHCISEWGHDFRPDYRELKKLRQLFPAIPILALTATATPQVKIDIDKQLGLKATKAYQASFDRKNLTYIVRQKQSPYEQILQYVNKHRGESGILYCFSRKDVEAMAEFLQSNNIKALPYHAGLEHTDRQKHQEAFIRENADIIVATIAFGMGIDKPNVRFVMHVDLPKSLEGYYQETGRAGRDGLPSECVFLYNYGDKRKIEFFITQKDEKQQEVAYKQLNDMVNYAKFNNCRRIAILNYFGEKYEQTNCKACDNCLNPKETFDATILAQKVLSCVYRLHERYGMKHVVGVLTGTNGERILALGHDKLSTFGIVTEYGRQDLHKIVRELIDQGYLKIEGTEYPVIKLTEKSKQVLLKKETVRLTKLEEKEIKTKNKFSLPFERRELFEVLRRLRKRLADEQQVPPYVIFSDNTLIDMVSVLPRTQAALGNINGVGYQKLQKYGTIFLKEITAYCKSHPGIMPIAPIRRDVKSYISTIRKPSKTTTIEETVKLFRQGLSVEKIAKQRGLVISTISSHLANAYIYGENIDLNQFVAKEKQAEIKKVFKELGYAIENNYLPLAPVKEILGENYSYDELQFVRAMMIREKQ